MSRRLARALRAHREAVAAAVDTIRSVPADAWSMSPGDDGWTPAQIAEHLILTYEGGIRDAAGGAAARPRVRPGWQRVLRWVLLPHILFHRSFPLRARSPREWRPEGSGVAAAEAPDRLARRAHEFEAAAERAYGVGRRFRHPYFGALDAVSTLRLAAVHLDHHRRQLAQRSPRPRG